MASTSEFILSGYVGMLAPVILVCILGIVALIVIFFFKRGGMGR